MSMVDVEFHDNSPHICPSWGINITGINVILHIYQISCKYDKWKH